MNFGPNDYFVATRILTLAVISVAPVALQAPAVVSALGVEALGEFVALVALHPTLVDICNKKRYLK